MTARMTDNVVRCIAYKRIKNVSREQHCTLNSDVFMVGKGMQVSWSGVFVVV
jgi:hypothetical protein